MSDIRIIKKYPNRRLYDTQESRYITLNDVRKLVLDDTEFEVIDKKTGDNITRSILLQVISEQEQQGDSVMSEDFLAQVIRAYSGNMPSMVRGFLESSLGMFVEQQQRMADTFRDSVGMDPVSAMTELAQQNMNQWLDWQQQLLKSVTPSNSRDQRGSSKG